MTYHPTYPKRRIDPTESALLEVIDHLHEDAWDVFASAKGPRLERVLNGETP